MAERERIDLKQALGLDNPKSEALGKVIDQQLAVSQRLYDMRTESGLSQAEVAQLVGTSPSVIGQIEDADYNLRNSLRLLDQVAQALGYELSGYLTPAGAATG